MIINEEFPVIETSRIRLRKIEASDCHDLFNIFSSEETMKYYGMYPFKEISEVETMIKNFSNGFKENRTIRWGIELKSEEILIGSCGFHNWNKTHMRAEIGYELNSLYRRQGIMTEAISEILKYGFKKMNLNRIEALVYPENLPSIDSLEKLNFSREGLLKDYCVFRGKKQDLLMYSILENTPIVSGEF